ncbi:hypothetical protein MJ581_03810 [Escherichia coli]|nr:hypothetical protein MJ581_03810 [Escherichia coli]
MALNGEICNHQALHALNGSDRYQFQTGSDCEVILALYQEKGAGISRRLTGHVCLCPVRQRKRCLIGRDHLGIIPPVWAMTNMVSCMWPQK